MNMVDSRKVTEEIAEKVKRLLAKQYARLTIEKHENNVYIEETDKHKSTLK